MIFIFRPMSVVILSFSLSKAGGEQLTLCVEMNDKVTEENGEQRFFEADGQANSFV